mmetsp:Transcript_17708/g.25984  ORF Transcript_17708/g.25984 Transcript_17708/m.25984 type:complete len:473 (-) Transcript_17708:491-1909(-)
MSETADSEVETIAPSTTTATNEQPTPVDVPADAPADAPANEAADTTEDTTEDTTVDVPVDTPAETPAETPVETPAETPIETPAETNGETSVDTPADTDAAQEPEMQAPAITATTEEEATMKSIQVHKFSSEFGKVDEGMLTFSTTTAKPKTRKKTKSKDMIIRVLTCSTSPADTLMMKGDIVFLHPSKGFPYVPCMDVCGVVEEIDSGVTEFKVGDYIVANNGFSPEGGMAEYMLVKSSNATLKPGNVDIIQAAAASSAVTALHASEHVTEGDRVLILGGSGGVGTSAITLAKSIAGASFVATTSTQAELCKDLGADVVIDYREQNWWEMKEFQENKFDKIIDTVGGGNFENAILVLKNRRQGGEFIAVAGDDPTPKVGSWFGALKASSGMRLRSLGTRLRPRNNPGYIMLTPYDEINGLAQVLQLVQERKLKIVVDPVTPLPFSEEGAKKAFDVQGSRHAHGKIVLKIADE